MNREYIARALCFHGQPLQKLWDDERGIGDLQKCGVPQQPDYAIFQERQKYLTFQDRAKRLKLHQFLARKANDLYDKDLEIIEGELDDETMQKVKPYYATLPPYEFFVKRHPDKPKRFRCVLECIKPGDFVYGIVTRNMPICIKPVCAVEPLLRILSDIPIKAYVETANVGLLPLDRSGAPRNYVQNDLVCCEVLEISVDAERLYLSMKDSALSKKKNIKLGYVTSTDLPDYYRKSNVQSNESYAECLRQAQQFGNPNYDVLYGINGLNINETYSLMGCFKQGFPQHEYAKELRQAQASKWAIRSVAEGIEHFKNGLSVEAFQCLNRALNIDPKNVEGLVARGALLANKGSFIKAVDDFEKALALDASHVNARKYMAETLVALGRSFEEDDKRLEDAVKAYVRCLQTVSDHEQARLSLESILKRCGRPHFDNFLQSIPKGSDVLDFETEKKNRKRKTSSSSTDSSSSSSSNGNDSDSEDNQSTNASKKKAASLSPISKRMALHASSMQAPQAPPQTVALQLKQPFFMANTAPTRTIARNPNEFQLDDDDTESRVRKLLQEASKHKKEKSKKSKKSKKKKDKKNKKSKQKESKENTKLALISAELEIDEQVQKNLHDYEESIQLIKMRQDLLSQSITSTMRNIKATAVRCASDSPPPPPPRVHSFKLGGEAIASTSSGYASSLGSANNTTAAPAHKLSFQIKRPVKVDKFGLVRVATPLADNVEKSLSPQRFSNRGFSHSRSRSPTRRHYREQRKRSQSRSRSHSKSRERRSPYRRRRTLSRSRSRSGGHRRNVRSRRSRSARSRSRQRSSSRRHYRRASRSRSSSPTRAVSYFRGGYLKGYRGSKRSRGFIASRRRSQSPLEPKGTTPSRSRRSRSRSTRSRSATPSPPGTSSRSQRRRHGSSYNQAQYSWTRPGYEANPSTSSDRKLPNTASDGRWLHDKFDENDKGSPKKSSDVIDDIEQSIDEIDELVSKERKERIQKIIEADKEILKKPVQ